MANPRTIENRRQKLLKSQQKPAVATSKKSVSKAKKKTSRQTAPPAPQIVTPPKKVAPLKPPEAPVPEVETVDYSSMTKSQLQDLLKERGVAYLPRSTNRILIGLLENV